MNAKDLDEFYDDYERIEEEFQLALDESLNPRGPDQLYDIVSGLGLPTGTSALDLGCGGGKNALHLAREFGFRVLGVDPITSHIQECNDALADEPELAERVSFAIGSAESIPADDASIDLIWCREMMMYVDLPVGFAEFRRILRPGGRMLVYQVFPTDKLEPLEAASDLLADVAPQKPAHIEAAATAAGFTIEQCIEIGGEWGEWWQESTGEPARRLLHTARLLHDPDRYITRFGKTAYGIMLGDCLWHVYRMIGKLSGRAYVLSAPA